MSISFTSVLNNPAQLQKLNKNSAVLVSVALAIGVAWSLSQLTWQFFPQEDGQTTQPGKKQVVISYNQTQNGFRQITAANLFGVKSSQPTIVQTRVPETRLNLTLKGVLAANPMELAVAIISEGKQGKEEVYSVGDKLRSGVLIKEIHPEYVILDRQGKLETLKLPKTSQASSGFIRKQSINFPGRVTPAKKQNLSSIRRNIILKPTSFGDYAIPRVVKENGRQIGYRLDPQERGDLLAKVGLQPTDIITEINKVRLDNPKNGIKALRKLTTAKTLNLKVKRNGTIVPINIDMTQ